VGEAVEAFRFQLVGAREGAFVPLLPRLRVAIARLESQITSASTISGCAR